MTDDNDLASEPKNPKHANRFCFISSSHYAIEVTMKLELLSVVIRAYKKKNGRISLHLKGHLLVYTNKGFSLTEYVKDMRCWIGLPGKKEQIADLLTVGVSCTYDKQVMIHDLTVSTVLKEREIKLCAVDLRMMFHVSFAGHSSEEPTFLRRKAVAVPVRHQMRETVHQLTYRHG